MVALSCGPIGALLEPNGSLKMEEAYDIFREMMTIGERAGADLIVCETITDLLEMKAAVLAAKENTRLPVFCTMSFEANGHTFTGTGLASMALTLEGLGARRAGHQLFPGAGRDSAPRPGACSVDQPAHYCQAERGSSEPELERL